MFHLPPLVEVFTYAAKAATKNDAPLKLVRLSSVVIFSQLTLSEASGIVIELIALDHRDSFAPRALANDLACVAIMIINAWQARENIGDNVLGDLDMLAQRISDIRDKCAELQLKQYEMDTEKLKRKIAERKTS